jgi:hypothetical protein
MSFAALVWLGYEFYRLLWQPTHIGSYQVHPGAIDLKQRYNEVHGWFSGMPVYVEIDAVYPPASYVILWPLLGWIGIRSAIFLWAVTSAVAIGWLAYLVIRQSGANTPLENLFVGLLPLSMYATGATVGNGQLIVHILPILLAGLLLVHQRQNTWRSDLLGSTLVLMSLVKPNVTTPFFWIVLFKPGRFRPAVLVSLGYFAFTLAAACFQEPSLLTLIRGWMARSSNYIGRDGYADLHILLTKIGLEEWMLPTSLLVLVLFGCWTYYYRNVDLWLLLSVAAFVARFWTYHRWYDDLLLLLPTVALFRIARMGSSEQGDNLLAGVLLGLMALTLIAPGGLFLFSPPWNMLYVKVQLVVWVTVLIFFCNRTRREKSARALL